MLFRSFPVTINGFMAWAINEPSFMDLFREYPQLRLYGEWLVPHTLKIYHECAWRNFYVFDVMSGDEYLHYDDYSKILSTHGIEYMPSGWRLKVLRGPYRSTPPLALSNGQTTGSLSIVGLSVEDRKSTRLNSSHEIPSRMPSSA